MAKITIEQINDFIAKSTMNGEEDTNITTTTWDFGDIKIKKHISLNEIIEISTSVAQCVFIEATGEYMPEVVDTVFWGYIIQYYTDVDLPEAATAQHDVITNTNIIDVVLANASQDEIHNIRDSVDARIKNIIDGGNNTVVQTMLEAYSHMMKLSEEFRNALVALNSIADSATRKEEQKDESKPDNAPKKRKSTAK